MTTGSEKPRVPLEGTPEVVASSGDQAASEIAVGGLIKAGADYTCADPNGCHLPPDSQVMSAGWCERAGVCVLKLDK